MKTQNQNPKSEKAQTLDEQKVKASTKPLYRYFCHACTGIAFMSDVKRDKGTKKCQVCGTILKLEEKNYIKA